MKKYSPVFISEPPTMLASDICSVLSANKVTANPDV